MISNSQEMVLGFLLAMLTLVATARTRDTPNLNPHSKLVVFSFDGFRYDYLTKAHVPTLNRLKESGVTTPYMIPQFTTKTFTNHQSIVTGLYSENHGIVENAVFDPLLNQELSGYEDDHDFWDYSNDVIPIWLLNELAGEGRISGAQFPGSTQPYGIDQQIITHSLAYDGSLPFKARMDYAINWLTNETHPANLVFMYFEEPDKQGHSYGPDSSQVKEAIENLDAMTAYFLEELERLGISEEVNIIILSDHGMEEVREKNKIPLAGLIDPNLKYEWRGGSPLLQIWPEREEETEALYAAFLEASETKPFNVYRKPDFPEKWHYDNRRVSPILLEATAGFAFDEQWERRENRHQRSGGEVEVAPETPRGYHGYDIDSPNMRAFFLAYGPAFQKGVSLDPFHNVDLFPLMCKLIELDPPKHDGNLQRVNRALVASGVPEETTDDPNSSSTHASTQMMTLLLFLSSLATALVLRTTW